MLEVAKEAFAFADDIFGQWQWLLGGSVAVWAVAGLLDAYLKRRKAPRVTREVKIGVVLLLACALAWHAKYQRLNQIEEVDLIRFSGRVN
jgi:hypothetical protein